MWDLQFGKYQKPNPSKLRLFQLTNVKYITRIKDDSRQFRYHPVIYYITTAIPIAINKFLIVAIPKDYSLRCNFTHN